ncbi:hypothetical protein TH53_06765 [Pedobacter lusitanus]|uniref:Tryptophan synthase beta chain-like PALP domain-containing protein n=1 Tax=Pedobacter lusitanus TaxID=1503925 RepID=A0A0D0GTY3_9SPHI|nr:pyridoxal-phosphate dependent enzyme [Pedobacter lusitanus]KIO77836.1 hypothetical protein TH53_06765 [Pedobacter lusitanus]
MIALQDIRDAHNRISPFIHHTPVLTNSYLNSLTVTELYFKCENFQKTGAFKARGGLNSVLQAAADDGVKSIVTHSSGNHAQVNSLISLQIPGVKFNRGFSQKW